MRLQAKLALRMLNNDLRCGRSTNTTYTIINSMNKKAFDQIKDHFLFKLHMRSF